MIKEEVLVIDDNDVTRDILKMILEEEGFTVQGCAIGRSALDLTKKKPFGIYVIDYSMPDMKGDALTAEMRKLYPGSFIVGLSVESKESAFLDAGADKFIIKDRLISELIPSIKERKPRTV